MYDYQTERGRIFTEDGQRGFLQLRDEAFSLIEKAGAVSSGKLMTVMAGDTWFCLACLDRLVELNDLREVTESGKFAGQDRIFVRVCRTA